MTRRLSPSFIGIGFQRCGTSWLNQVMFEHPQIGKPRSGLHFFTDNYDKGVEWYERTLATFDTGTGIVGEFSTPYCYLDAAEMVADRILANYPDVKLIFSIREPIDRSRSDYRRLMRNGEIPDTGLSYADAIQRYPEILARSCYAPVLKLFYERFTAEHIHIIRYDDIKSDPVAVVGELYTYLDVDSSFRPDSLTHRLGASYEMKSPLIERVIRRMQSTGRKILSLSPPAIESSVRRFGRKVVESVRITNTRNDSEIVQDANTLQRELYDDDIRQVIEVTGHDLRKWSSR